MFKGTNNIPPTISPPFTDPTTGLPSYFTTVPAGGVISFQIHSDDFDVYPNPSSGSFNIYLELPFKKDISMKIFDVNGRVVRETFKENFLNQLFSFEDIPNGIYTVLLNVGNERMKKNIVITD